MVQKAPPVGPTAETVSESSKQLSGCRRTHSSAVATSRGSSGRFSCVCVRVLSVEGGSFDLVAAVGIAVRSEPTDQVLVGGHHSLLGVHVVQAVVRAEELPLVNAEVGRACTKIRFSVLEIDGNGQHHMMAREGTVVSREQKQDGSLSHQSSR